MWNGLSQILMGEKKKKTYIYRHFCNHKVAAFLNAFKSHHFTPNDHVDHNAIYIKLFMGHQKQDFMIELEGKMYFEVVEKPAAKHVAIRLVYVS